MASKMDWAMRGFGGEENQERGARERTRREPREHKVKMGRVV